MWPIPYTVGNPHTHGISQETIHGIALQILAPSPHHIPQYNVHRSETRQAKVLGLPCVFRAAQNVSDEAIVFDYAGRLRAALKLLRARFSGRLILRSCHSGTRDIRTNGEASNASDAQFEALLRQDAALRSVARELGVEVMEVKSLCSIM